MNQEKKKRITSSCYVWEMCASITHTLDFTFFLPFLTCKSWYRVDCYICYFTVRGGMRGWMISEWMDRNSHTPWITFFKDHFRNSTFLWSQKSSWAPSVYVVPALLESTSSSSPHVISWEWIVKSAAATPAGDGDDAKVKNVSHSWLLFSSFI